MSGNIHFRYYNPTTNPPYNHARAIIIMSAAYMFKSQAIFCVQISLRAVSVATRRDSVWRAWPVAQIACSVWLANGPNIGLFIYYSFHRWPKMNRIYWERAVWDITDWYRNDCDRIDCDIIYIIKVMLLTIQLGYSYH